MILSCHIIKLDPEDTLAGAAVTVKRRLDPSPLDPSPEDSAPQAPKVKLFGGFRTANRLDKRNHLIYSLKLMTAHLSDLGWMQ